MVKHVVKGPCSRKLREMGSAGTPVITRDCGISDFARMPGVLHAPKCRALPVELHPDIHFSAIIPRRGVKIKFFLSVVIPVVKAAFVPLSAIGGNPANAGVARLCGVSPYPVPDTATALPNVAPYQLSHTRIFTFCHNTTAEEKARARSAYGRAP